MSGSTVQGEGPAHAKSDRAVELRISTYTAGGSGIRDHYCACTLLTGTHTYPFPFLPNRLLWMGLGNSPLFTTLIL